MKPFKSLIIAACLASPAVMAQQIVDWTEQNGTLGLGYPVPIPVDTSEPFDGFRTYNGLHQKHQMIANDNPNITAHVVGQSMAGRDIWAYRLSDADETTRFGTAEGGMLMNAGIHAREWQSPEVSTAIIELIHANRNDQSIHQYLLENTSIVIIPVNNVDGFLQTQRYPRSNYYSPQSGPRDGRMRRKNMRGVDEVLTTSGDHLLGIDLNRNNDPYWAFTENWPNPRSSGNPTSIVYRGSAAFSEPESQARLASVNLLDANHLRVYTDVHSFSQVHFSTFTFNNNRNILQTQLLSDFTNYHAQLPGNKVYVDVPSGAGAGIGSTDEYFGNTYEIPSWTLEIEPSGNLNPDVHPNLPGNGADYGGFRNDGHDGFILPESEIRRVRENLAKAFVATWYGQAGPPTMLQMRIIDPEIDAVIYDAEWDWKGQDQRELFTNQVENLKPGKTYQMLLRFDKPMRISDAQGQAAGFPGISPLLDPVIQARLNGNNVTLTAENGTWLKEKNATWQSYKHYQYDTYVVDVTIDSTTGFQNGDNLNWRIVTSDLVGQLNDADPSSAVTWAGGQWQNLQDSNGNTGIAGGFDGTLNITLSDDSIGVGPPRVAATGMYFAANRSGEGISLEVIDFDNIWMTWYTFDDQGNQNWYTSQNNYQGNVIKAPLYQVDGGVFGPDLDPNDIDVSEYGEIELVFGSGVSWGALIGYQTMFRSAAVKFTDPDGRIFRTVWEPLAVTDGFASDLFFTGIFDPPPVPNSPPAYTGSWFSMDRSGVGYQVHILSDGRAALLWFDFGPNGEKKWFVDMDGMVTETNDGVTLQFDNIVQAQGTVFGPDFNPNDVIITPWGSATFHLTCTEGSMSYQSADSNYGSGGYDIQRLTSASGNVVPCTD